MSKFGAIPTEVICRFHELTKTEIIVLSYLYAARNRKTGRCNPSRGEIARKVGIAKSHVSPALKNLSDKEWIWEHADGNFQITEPSTTVTESVTEGVTDSGTVTESVTVTDFGKNDTESVTRGYGIGNSTPIYLNKEGTQKNTEEKRASENGNKNNNDWISTLKKEPIYSHVDFDRELRKAQLWINDHPGRKLTKRFFTNWINKIEPPLLVTPKKPEMSEDERKMREALHLSQEAFYGR